MICLEFKRIVGKDLQQEFYSALDDHRTRLMEIFKAKRGNVGEHLAQLLQQMQSLDPTEKRTVALRGLPHLLGDNPTEFFKSSSSRKSVSLRGQVPGPAEACCSEKVQMEKQINAEGAAFKRKAKSEEC
uniref:Uncharacterized protein n=1 Tax=Knipowitschia caucasica TaxID=637954 RepID=A0AAV2L153_KNICA